jgi:hypothetical protein
VYNAADFVAGFVAECLPVQVVMTDAKPHLPKVASQLAVQDIGGEQEFIGSFDAMLRVRARIGASVWRRWDMCDGVLDVKMTGAAEPFGLNSPSMRRWLATGRLVMRAARKVKDSPVGKCAFVAWLIRRPRGPSFRSKGGREHAGSYAFLAFDAETLSSWDPKTSAPKPFLMLGDQIINGAKPESESVFAQPLAPPMQRMQGDPWEVFRSTKATSGWCTIHQFIDFFKLKGKGEIKSAAARWAKRLRDANCELKDEEPHGRARPFKKARVADLKRVYKLYKDEK